MGFTPLAEGLGDVPPRTRAPRVGGNKASAVLRWLLSLNFHFSAFEVKNDEVENIMSETATRLQTPWV